MIYELEIKKHADTLYEWMLLRVPHKIDDGWCKDLASTLVAPIRLEHVEPGDRLAVTVDGIAVGIYPASTGDDEAARVVRDIVAILRS